MSFLICKIFLILYFIVGISFLESFCSIFSNLLSVNILIFFEVTLFKKLKYFLSKINSSEYDIKYIKSISSILIVCFSFIEILIILYSFDMASNGILILGLLKSNKPKIICSKDILNYYLITAHKINFIY